MRDAYSLGCSHKSINTLHYVHKAISWPGYMEIGNVMLLAIVLQHISSCSSGFKGHLNGTSDAETRLLEFKLGKTEF